MRVLRCRTGNLTHGVEIKRLRVQSASRSRLLPEAPYRPADLHYRSRFPTNVLRTLNCFSLFLWVMSKFKACWTELVPKVEGSLKLLSSGGHIKVWTVPQFRSWTESFCFSIYFARAPPLGCVYACTAPSSTDVGHPGGDGFPHNSRLNTIKPFLRTAESRREPVCVFLST